MAVEPINDSRVSADSGELSPQDRERLIHQCLDLVKIVASQHSLGNRNILEEAIGDGMLGLVKAANTWDPSRGVPFDRYANLCISGAIIDGQRSFNRVIRKEHYNGEGPRAKMVSLLNDTKALSLTLPDPEGDEDHVIDLPGGYGDPEVEQIRTEDSRGLADDLKRLSENQRYAVIECYLKNRTMAVVALEIGLTESRVSQLCTEACEKLRLLHMFRQHPEHWSNADRKIIIVALRLLAYLERLGGSINNTHFSLAVRLQSIVRPQHPNKMRKWYRELALVGLIEFLTDGIMGGYKEIRITEGGRKFLRINRQYLKDDHSWSQPVVQNERGEMSITETSTEERSMMVTQEEAIRELEMVFPIGHMPASLAFTSMRIRYGLRFGNVDGEKQYNLAFVEEAWAKLLTEEPDLRAVQTRLPAAQPPETIPAAADTPDDVSMSTQQVYQGSTVQRLAAYLRDHGGRVEDPGGRLTKDVAESIGCTSAALNQLLTKHPREFGRDSRSGKRTYAIWLIEKESAPAVPETPVPAPTPQASEEPVSATTAEAETSEAVEVVDADHVTNLELAIGNGHVEPTIAASLLTRQLARRSATFDRLDDLTIARITAELVASTMSEASAE